MHEKDSKDKGVSWTVAVGLDGWCMLIIGIFFASQIFFPSKKTLNMYDWNFLAELYSTFDWYKLKLQR